MSGVAWGKLTAPDEEYLKAAVARLLPEYYSGDAAADDDGKVLRRMADEFEARHGDTWLRDVLKTPHSRRAADAFGALRRAVEAETRDWTKSSTEADMAGLDEIPGSDPDGKGKSLFRTFAACPEIGRAHV